MWSSTACLQLALLTLSCACTAHAGGPIVVLQSQATGRHLLADSCAAQGLDGKCSGKCCCCYAGGAGIVSYEPTDACTCKRVVNSTNIWATVVLSIILVLGGLLCQLFFGGSLPISPYPRQQQGRQRNGRITPDDAAQQRPGGLPMH